MASRVIDRKTYDRLIEAFRERPGNWSHASRVAACSRGMAQRAYERGWPDRFEWAGPIREILAAENIAVRATVFEMADELAPKAAAVVRRAADLAKAAEQDVVNIRALEVIGVRAAIVSGNDLMQAFAELAREALDVVRAATRKMREQLAVGEVDPAEVVAWLSDLSATGQRLTVAYQTAMKMERLRTGEAESTTKLLYEFGSEAEALAELEAAAEAARVFKQRQERLRLVQGGKAEAAG